jgi:xylan 1,4-beta-xylosidase
MKEYTLDVRSEKIPLKKYWELCVGSCHAATALREDWREMLKQCRRDIGFRYVRFHGLFDDDMSVVVAAMLGGTLQLSFTNIDKIFDFLLSIGMKPFIEIGFMPEVFASGKKTIFHYKGNTTPPKDYDQWAWFIGEFAKHLVGRYGLGEVRQWFFEVWNEPNLGGPDSPFGFWAGDQAEYFKLYQVTAEALKKVDSLLPVGGPATSNNAWIPEFISFCRKNKAPVDFITTHHYPTDVVLGFGVEDSANLNPLSVLGDPEKLKELAADPKAREEFGRQYAVFQATLWERVDRGVLTGMTRRAVSEAEGLPVYYTEWSSLAGLPSDGPFGASFIPKTVLDGRDLVEGYSFWTFCDIFEEQGQKSPAFSGEYGLMTQHGIPKAPYRAFQLLHQLGDSIYQHTGAEGTLDVYAVEKREAGALQLMLVNHHSLLHPIAAEKLSITLSGAKPCVRAEIQRVDEDHANALAAWQNLGSPEYLGDREVFLLKGASELVREDQSFEQTGDTLKLQVALPPMATALVTLYFR